MIDFSSIKTKTNKILLNKITPEIRKEIEEETNFLDNSASLLFRIRILEHEIKEQPRCKHCRTSLFKINGNFCSRSCANAFNREKADETIFKKYGVKNPSQAKEIQEKIKSTFQERYGVDHPMQLDSTKQKIKETCLEKYGTEYPQQSLIIQEKIKSTFQERYGADHPMQLDSTKQKIKETCLERYGVENPFLLESIKQKIKETCLEQYGVEFYTQLESTKQKIKETCLERYGVDNPSKLEEIKKQISDKNKKFFLDLEQLISLNSSLNIPQIANSIGCSSSLIYHFFDKEQFDYIRHTYQSLPQLLLINYLKSLNVEIEINNRNQIHPLELDIFLPEYSLAIEINGIYWHSELSGNKNQQYHLSKLLKCEEVGIQLLHFTDQEILTKFDIVCSMITAKIKKLSNRIFARNCIVLPATRLESKEFLENNHIQGFTQSSLFFKLINKETKMIMGVMTFSKPRFNKSFDLELTRFAVLKQYSIPGAFNKLLKNSNVTGNIISYSMKNYSLGDVYKKSGWKLISNNSPNYWYTKDYRNLEHRSKFQKHKLPKLLEQFDPDKTEWENMIENGYDRVWDCGTKTWLLEI
jgi:hypothetical protein